MLSHKLVSPESTNFTSGLAVLAPPTIPINHYFSSIETNKIELAYTHRWCADRAEVLSYYSMLIDSGISLL